MFIDEADPRIVRPFVKHHHRGIFFLFTLEKDITMRMKQSSPKSVGTHQPTHVNLPALWNHDSFRLMHRINYIF